MPHEAAQPDGVSGNDVIQGAHDRAKEGAPVGQQHVLRQACSGGIQPAVHGGVIGRQ
jgi:hypothetical protein